MKKFFKLKVLRKGVILISAAILIYINFKIDENINEYYKKNYRSNASPTLFDKNEWILECRENSPEFPLNKKNPFFLLNDHICKDIEGLYLIILIHSAPDHFANREAIRKTWANYNGDYQKKIRRVFIFGKVESDELQRSIELEQKLYSDILQSEFVDSYHNLSLNTLYGLRWVEEHCRNAKVVMKVDDDVCVDIHSVMARVVNKYTMSTKHVFCNMLTEQEIPREPTSKTYVSKNDFPGQRVFPPYCEGKVVIFTVDVVQAILQEAYFTKLFWIEDVYIYGLVLSKVHGISYDIYTFSAGLELQSKKISLRSPCTTMFAEVHETKYIYSVWNVFRKRHCETPVYNNIDIELYVS